MTMLLSCDHTLVVESVTEGHSRLLSTNPSLFFTFNAIMPHASVDSMYSSSSQLECVTLEPILDGRPPVKNIGYECYLSVWVYQWMEMW